LNAEIDTGNEAIFNADAMTERANRHLGDMLSATGVRTNVTPHFAFQNLLPADVYALVDRYWPGDGFFKSLNDSALVRTRRPEFENKYSSDRLEEPLDGLSARLPSAAAVDFWHWLVGWLKSEFVARAMLERLSDPEISKEASLAVQDLKLENLETEVVLQEDREGCSLPVHRDSDLKVVSMIVYIARLTDPDRFGTRVYQLKRSTIERLREGKIHLSGYNPFDYFDEVFAAPYRQNSGFVFLNNSQLWHGVREIDHPGACRRVLLWNLVHPRG
jgi:hypothetical protein